MICDGQILARQVISQSVKTTKALVRQTLVRTGQKLNEKELDESVDLQFEDVIKKVSHSHRFAHLNLNLNLNLWCDMLCINRSRLSQLIAPFKA